MNINIVISSHLNASVKACVVPNDDDSYTILVNYNLSREAAIKSIIHEVMHIKQNDFSSEEHAGLLERLIRYNDLSSVPWMSEYSFFWQYDL